MKITKNADYVFIMCKHMQMFKSQKGVDLIWYYYSISSYMLVVNNVLQNLNSSIKTLVSRQIRWADIYIYGNHLWYNLQSITLLLADVIANTRLALLADVMQICCGGDKTSTDLSCCLCQRNACSYQNLMCGEWLCLNKLQYYHATYKLN